MDKKFTLPSGGKVIIEINNPPEIQNPKSKIQNAKGLIAARREDEYLPRRLQKKFINFYDLGRMKVGGVYVDIEFYIESTYTTDASGSIFFSELTVANHNALADLVLTGGVENLAANAYKIPYGEGNVFNAIVQGATFSRSTSGTPETNLFWTAQGLKLTAGELSADDYRVTSQHNSIWTGVNLTGAFKNKITAVRDYNAAAVVFTPRASDDYFYMPRLMRVFGSAQETGATHNYTDSFRIFPRVTDLIFPSNTFYSSAVDDSWASGQSVGIYTNIKRIVAELKARAHLPKSFKQTPDGANVLTTPQVPSDFPTSANFGESPGAGASFFSAGFQYDNPPVGVLLMIIRQGTFFFYVWSLG